MDTALVIPAASLASNSQRMMCAAMSSEWAGHALPGDVFLDRASLLCSDSSFASVIRRRGRPLAHLPPPWLPHENRGFHFSQDLPVQVRLENYWLSWEKAKNQTILAGRSAISCTQLLLLSHDFRNTLDIYFPIFISQSEIITKQTLR